MTQEQWQAVDEYITNLFGPDDPTLAAALQDSVAAGLPPIAVTPPLGRLLHLLALSVGARRILEIGALAGYSAIWLARALPPDGRLITLEFDPRHAEIAQTNIARAGLADRAEVRVGRAIDSLAELVAEGGEPFDLIFIDADKPSYLAYLQASLKLARSGALIVADNVVRQGRVADVEDDDANVRGVRQFNAALAAEPHLTATIVQTVSSKGYDGVAIAVVNS
jgi:predicted O-methyltransferase YrrM